MHRRDFVTGALAGAAAPPFASAARAADPMRTLARLAERETHAIMRHAIAPGTGDPEGFVLGDCSTQRNLSETGREQARASGRLIEFSGARVDRVLSSQWCRCLETARLMDLGEVVEEPSLNSFFGNRSAELPQTAELRRLLANTPPDETLLLVTHQVNIRALLGAYANSGDILIFRARDDGRTMRLGRVNALP